VRQEYRRKNSVKQARSKAEAPSGFSRRKFFAGLGVSMAASFLPGNVIAGILGSSRVSLLQRSNGLHEAQMAAEVLYPPVDLSYFEIPIGRRG
jgi:hypothetical protein